MYVVLTWASLMSALILILGLGRRWSWPLTALLLLGLTARAYFLGLLTMLDSEGPFPFPGADESYLPLGHVCRWQDGRSIDTVPGYVNPVVMTLAATTVLATARREEAVPCHSP